MRLDAENYCAEITKGLTTGWGMHPEANKPLFRLAYVGNLTERRKGDFKVYLEGTDVLVREEKNVVRDVKKYAYLDDDRFIVEKLVPNPHSDVFGENFTYESVYCFALGVRPPLRACVFLINALLVMGGNAPKTEKEAVDRDKEKMKVEKIRTREILDTHFDYTDISLRLKHGSAVTDFNSKV